MIMTEEKANELVAENERLVHLVMHKCGLYFKYGHDQETIDNIYSYGMEGLYIGIRAYDESKGALSTIACLSIKNKIFHYLRNRNALKRNKEANGISLVHYDALYDNVKGNDAEYSEFVLPSNDNIDEHQEMKHIMECFNRLYNSLSLPQHRRIIRTWANSGFAMRQMDISRITGVTQSQVSRVIVNFRKKLKAILNNI